ncbi:hypothetical protein FHX37_1568 [Haloactinospora alba]|uniref:Uncharacterized protein n=1 Tax=Haloactinospora alba TaxID=405555 RepID=A0A543NII6_9ACTN|nr:hypothetical protein FHX37_1568 [Haloactinospora alba]
MMLLVCPISFGLPVAPYFKRCRRVEGFRCTPG